MPIPFDFDRVVAEAVRRGVWLEINASPERLDLNGALIRTAKAKGARFTISTDAHHPKHLANMRYGVITARRGWLGPADILNTLPADGIRRRAFAKQIMKITSSREVYNCSLFRVTEDEAADPKTGFQIKRSVVRHAGSAVMMAVDEKKRILLVRQYRLPAAKYLWELPAGRLDPGEKPLQAAKRELSGRDRLQSAHVEKAGVLLAQPRLRGRADDHLPGDRSDRRRSATHGRRAHRKPLVYAQGIGRHDPGRQDRRRQDDDWVSDLAAV